MTFLFWILCIHVCMCVGVLISVMCVYVYSNQAIRFVPAVQTGIISNLD